jgi:hypothetical protein
MNAAHGIFDITGRTALITEADISADEGGTGLVG